jgi:alpha-glucosidase (family GH31 glycosyl hydrolase)
MKLSTHLTVIYALLLTASLWRTSSAEYLSNYSSHEIRDESLIIYAGTSAISITPYTPNIIKVSLFPDGTIEPDSSVVVVLEPQNVEWQITDQDCVLHVTLGNLTLRIQKYPLRLRYMVNGTVVLSDENGFFWDGVERGVRFTLTPDEHVYGGGQRAISIDRRGQQLDSYNAPVYCYGFGAENLNITIPFLLSSRLYGLYFENTFPGHFDIGHSEPDVLEYRVDGGELSYFFIAGESVADLLDSYTHLTGKQPLPPRWALGYLQSRYGYENESQARGVVNTFREEHIPLDAIILDLYWFGWGGMGNLNWDYSHWPNPTQMIRDFDSVGVKTILITEPYIQESSSNFGTAYSSGYLTPDSTGNPVIMPNFWAGTAGLLDITLPEASDWFWSFYANLAGQGVGGWWCDLGEPELHPTEMVHHMGSAAEVHNIYSLLWAKLLYERYRQNFPDQRLFNLIRSGYAGMQRFSTFPWSGDVQRTFSGLQAQLPIMLSMGLSGVAYMGSDIGGFNCGPQDAELYIRWMQFGAFAPVMRAHGTGISTEPIFWDPATRDLVAEYIRLRYELLPYNYTLAWQNSIIGTPLARPLLFDEADESVANMYDEYLWGPSLLVAPVLQEGQTQRDVFLPSGVWIDYWSDATHIGRRWITAPAPLEKIPLYVRAGSFLPTKSSLECTEDYAIDTLFVHYYPDENVPTSTYTLYNDDGKTPNAYAAGQYETIDFQGTASVNNIPVQLERHNLGYPGAPNSIKMYFELHRIVHQPEIVRVAGTPLPFVQTLAELFASDSAVFFDETAHLLHTGFVWDGALSTLQIEGEQLLSTPLLQVAAEKDVILYPNYPNPFNPTTQIQFDLQRTSPVTLKVFNILGREVQTLLRAERLAQGTHVVTLNAQILPSGIYFYRLETSGTAITKKMILIR